MIMAALLENAIFRRAPTRNPEVVRNYFGTFTKFADEFPLQPCVFARALIQSDNVGLGNVYVVIVRVDYCDIPEMPRLPERNGTEPLLLLYAYHLCSIVIACCCDYDCAIPAPQVIDNGPRVDAGQGEHFLYYKR